MQYIASLLLDYINETSQTNHPGPSHLALREQGMGICLIFINSIVDQVVFFLMNKSIRISKRDTGGITELLEVVYSHA